VRPGILRISATEGKCISQIGSIALTLGRAWERLLFLIQIVLPNCRAINEIKERLARTVYNDQDGWNDCPKTPRGGSPDFNGRPSPHVCQGAIRADWYFGTITGLERLGVRGSPEKRFLRLSVVGLPPVK